MDRWPWENGKRQQAAFLAFWRVLCQKLMTQDDFRFVAALPHVGSGYVSLTHHPKFSNRFINR
jgi:hypothetical protein